MSVAPTSPALLEATFRSSSEICRARPERNCGRETAADSLFPRALKACRTLDAGFQTILRKTELSQLRAWNQVGFEVSMC